MMSVAKVSQHPSSEGEGWIENGLDIHHLERSISEDGLLQAEIRQTTPHRPELDQNSMCREQVEKVRLLQSGSSVLKCKEAVYKKLNQYRVEGDIQRVKKKGGILLIRGGKTGLERGVKNCWHKIHWEGKHWLRGSIDVVKLTFGKPELIITSDQSTCAIERGGEVLTEMK